MSSTDGAMVDLQSVAREVGIQIALKQVTIATIDAEIEPLPAAYGRLQLAARPVRQRLGVRARPLPDGRGDLPDRRARQRRQLLRSCHRQADRGDHDEPSAGGAQRALDAYANAVRLQLPDFWQPSPGTLMTFQSNLAGVTPNAYGFINPEEWYFTK